MSQIMSENIFDHHSDASEDGESQPTTEKKIVQFNDKGQPIGVGSAQFATFIGKMTRMHCPPAYSDWRSVPESIKDTIWNDVCEVYDLELFRRVCVLHKSNKAWREWKCNLRKIYDRYPTDVERKNNIPRGMKKKDWEEFVDFTSTDNELTKREMGRATREQMKLPNMSGRRGSARTEEQLKEQSIDGKVTRTQLFLAIHDTNDGASSKVDEVKKLVSIDPLLGEKDLDNDAVALVCGRDRRGRVRALGDGVSKTMLNASAPFREKAEKEKRKNEEVDSMFKVCMQRLDEETKARKLIEKKLASLMDDSTDSDSVTQGNGCSQSMSSDSCIPSSNRCLLKNFKKKPIALGTVCTEITPSDDYDVRIDDIFDSTTELYVGDGTLDDISIGDIITWHRDFVEFV